jgi:hypothetical protein
MTIPVTSFYSALLIASDVGEIGRFGQGSSSLVTEKTGIIHQFVGRKDVSCADDEIPKQMPEVEWANARGLHVS